MLKELSEKHTAKKGFTLIELIIVVAILAILAAILVPAMIAYINRANDRAGLANARAAYSAATGAVSFCLSDKSVTATPSDDPTSAWYAAVVDKTMEGLGSNFREENLTIVLGNGGREVVSVTYRTQGRAHTQPL